MNSDKYLEAILNEDNDSDIDSLVKKIAKMTDDNAHTYSVLELAKFLKNTKSIKVLTAFNELHKLYGSMPHQLGELRDFELKELLKQATEKYGKEISDKIKSAF